VQKIFLPAANQKKEMHSARQPRTNKHWRGLSTKIYLPVLSPQLIDCCGGISKHSFPPLFPVGSFDCVWWAGHTIYVIGGGGVVAIKNFYHSPAPVMY
jgi:hypothetical protein